MSTDKNRYALIFIPDSQYYAGPLLMGHPCKGVYINKWPKLRVNIFANNIYALQIWIKSPHYM